MNPRVAIVHEWFIDWAGSERVVEQILACFPGADLFALVDFLPLEHRKKILNKHVETTFLQRAPFAKKHLRYYLPWMPFAIEQLDLSAYDIIISSSHAVAKGVITGPHQLHVSYVHSPMRYAWDLQQEYLRGPNGKGIRGIALRWTLHSLRQWDLRTINGVDLFIANSAFVAKRINKYYRRDAAVIYPPVDVESFPLKEVKEDFYLCAGRLEPYKRIDVAVEAFKQMPDKSLVILGDGPELRSLKRNVTPNIEFIGYQTPENWLRYLQKAKALIFPGIEDFGISPIEAQACGTPVIAFGKGGALETVRPIGEQLATGTFFHAQSPKSLASAVIFLEDNYATISPQACRNNAMQFSAAMFRNKFVDFMSAATQF